MIQEIPSGKSPVKGVKQCIRVDIGTVQKKQVTANVYGQVKICFGKIGIWFLQNYGIVLCIVD